MDEKYFTQKKKQYAIIGGGIYGCQIALSLSKVANTEVTIYEKNDDILLGATKNNLWRIHRGYHYPRCKKTAENSMKSYPRFCDEYKEAVFNYEHLYAIAKEDSKTTAEDYLKFMTDMSLKYTILDTNEQWLGKYDTGSYKEKKRDCIATEDKIFHHDQLSLLVKVEESLYDSRILASIIKDKIQKANNIHLKLNHTIFWSLPVQEKNNLPYDGYILTTYYANNMFVRKQPPQTMMKNDDEKLKQTKYEFQLCEVIYGELPDKYKDKSLIVLDGEFTSINPVPNSNLFGIYHVKHTKHISFVDTRININKLPERYTSLINTGCKYVPEISKFKEVLRDSSKYFRDLKHFVYKGSTFTWRVKRVNVDNTDSRYYDIKEVGENVWSVFSGKVDEAILVGEEMTKIIRERNFNVALIGAGYWGEKYIQKLQNLSKKKKMKLKTVVVNSLESVRKNTEKYGDLGIVFTSNLDVVLKDPDIKGVIIASPDNTHHELTEKCLEANKDVLVEKPFKDTFMVQQDGKMESKLIKYAEEKNLVLDTGYVYLHNKYIQKIKKMIDAGEFGKIKHIRMQRTSMGKIYNDTNVGNNLAVHDISILLYWFGDFLSEDFGGENTFPWSLEPNHINRHLSESMAHYIFDINHVNNGIINVSLLTSWDMLGKTREITIYGENKVVSFDDCKVGGKIIEYTKNDKSDARVIDLNGGDPLERQLRKWGEKVKKKNCGEYKPNYNKRKNFEYAVWKTISDVK